MSRPRPLKAALVAVSIAALVSLFSLEYTVERGDTLGKIARDHGVSVSDLVEANDIANPNLILPGQVLVIPGEDGDPAQVHVVARGETLGRIAASYGTSVSALVGANSIPNPDFIRIGQEIVIPGSTGAAPKPKPPSSGGPSQAPAPEGQRSGAFHVVERGETLASIAAKYRGVSAEGIAQANGILNGRIYSGTRLFLDGPGHVASGAGGESSTYRIRPGDRLVDIARAHGTSVGELARVNSISNPNFIRSGQQLRIPGGSGWVCPVAGASFFNDWGFPRGGGTRWHEGNDLFADRATPFRAPVAGAVKQVTGSIGGKQVHLNGRDGVTYFGSHLSDFGRSGTVSAGDTIGYIGTSGNARGTRPHLHFEMWLSDGTVVNPYPSLIANDC